MNFKNWHYLLLIISICSITTALIAEFFFGLEPCYLCLKQREPYYLIIGLFIFFLFLHFQFNIWFFLAIQIISFYGLFYSVWHVGIENNLLNGPSGCSGDLQISDNTSNLKEQILSKAVINCEDVIWSIFGFSAASINSLILFLNPISGCTTIVI